MKIKSTLVNAFLLVMFVILQNCNAQENPAAGDKIYEGCCGTAPVEFPLDDKRYIYIPNVFTPNGDGINDHFMPFMRSKELMEIQKLTVVSAVGDTVLWQMERIHPGDDAKNYGWSGYRADGSRYRGKFKYVMAVCAVGFNQFVSGEACSVICEPGNKVMKSRSGCYYASQAGPDGTLEKSKVNQEQDCF
ncbi:gliding motility-associated C-terminal domain-containing protein [Dyadobacter bucti]|uniref:gliding motility-associated C-terminal domain-containing protein n=1 Tax=Dyadobacter bucti TaxID=2572203 RepID=UPI0011097361|nr:gliding motility-associated C-terminal domain-containing protein [Dyadobacter bucti]